RAQDAALPAVARRRPGGPPRPPGHRAAAAHLAMGSCAASRVHPAACDAAALLSLGDPESYYRPPPGHAGMPASTPTPPRSPRNANTAPPAIAQRHAPAPTVNQDAL